MGLGFRPLVKNPKRERFYWGGFYWPFNEAADYWESGLILEKLNNKRRGEAYQDADRDRYCSLGRGGKGGYEVAKKNMRWQRRI